MDSVPKLIGLVGLAGAGKDVVANHLRDLWDYEIVRFSDPLKDLVAEQFGFDRGLLDNWTYKNSAQGPFKVKPRDAMQLVGTEGFRAVAPDFWVVKGMALAADRLEGYIPVVIPDVRFLNEERAIRAAGGEIWRIVKGDMERAVDPHVSERELDEIKEDFRLQAPVGGVDELREQVYQRLETELLQGSLMDRKVVA